MNAIAKLFSAAGLGVLGASTAIPVPANMAVVIKTGIVTSVGSTVEVRVGDQTYRIVRNASNESALRTLHEGDQVDLNVGALPSKSGANANFVKLHPSPAQ